MENNGEANGSEQQPEEQKQKPVEAQEAGLAEEFSEDQLDEESLNTLNKMQQILQMSTQVLGNYKHEIDNLKSQIGALRDQEQDKQGVERFEAEIPVAINEVGAVYKEHFDFLMDENKKLQDELVQELAERKELEESVMQMMQKLESVSQRYDQLQKDGHQPKQE